MSSLANRQLIELNRAIAVAAGAAWGRSDSWSSASLDPILDLAARKQQGPIIVPMTEMRPPLSRVEQQTWMPARWNIAATCAWYLARKAVICGVVER